MSNLTARATETDSEEAEYQTKPKPPMSRTAVNFLLDSFLLVVFLLLLWVAVVVQFVFPAAAQAAGWTLWGWTYGQWQSFQFAVHGAMALAVLLHVMLHWSWVCGVVASRVSQIRGRKRTKVDEGAQTLYGVGTLIVILNIMGLAIAAAVLTIQGPP